MNRMKMEVWTAATNKLNPMHLIWYLLFLFSLFHVFLYMAASILLFSPNSHAWKNVFIFVFVWASFNNDFTFVLNYRVIVELKCFIKVLFYLS